MHIRISHVVMCKARLQAVGQPKPGPIRPGQAGPRSRPDEGFGPAWNFPKPKPVAQAAAFGQLLAVIIMVAISIIAKKNCHAITPLLSSHTSSESSRAATCHLRNRFLHFAHFFHAPVLAAHGDNECKGLLQCREWCYILSTCLYLDLLMIYYSRRKLNNIEKADYIEAITCLQSRPPLHQHIEAVKTRFDEFQALHIDVADRIHTTVRFTTAINTGSV
jgi:hypothetical protein